MNKELGVGGQYPLGDRQFILIDLSPDKIAKITALG